MNTTANTQEQIINGVNVTRMMETIEAVKGDPEIGDFKFRVKNTWQKGGYNEATITDFYGAKDNIPHEQPFVIKADEPDILLGKDQGPNPVETLLAALSGCMTTTLAYKSAGAGKTVSDVSSEFEGDIDLQGFLGIRPDVNKGYNEIRVKFKVKGDVTEDEVREMVKNSPVYDTLVRPIAIRIDVEKAG